jgi:hypothetical protein
VGPESEPSARASLTSQFFRGRVSPEQFRPRSAKKPFFCWFNSTRMHIFTHLKKESQGKTGLGVYPDGMVEH